MNKISVVSVVHNEEKYIGECYKRLQPYVDDFVVIDQESTDKTIEIAKKFTKKIFTFPRVYYPYAYIHEGALMANNNLILKGDPDEWWEEEVLKKLSSVIKQKADIYNFVMKTNKGIYHHPRIFRKDKILWSDSLDSKPISLNKIKEITVEGLAITHMKNLDDSPKRYRIEAATRLLVRYGDSKIQPYIDLCKYYKDIINEKRY